MEFNYTGCSVSGDTLHYRLKKSVFHRRTRQVTQLFIYLLTHKLFSSCIRRYLVSRASNWVMPALSVVLRIFSFQFSLLFFHVGSQAAAAAYMVYPISDTGRGRKCGNYVPCTAQGKDFKLISMVKMATRHPVEGQTGSEFPEICNHCGVVTAWCHKTLKFCEQFLRFFGKTTPCGKIFNILFQKFTWRHRLTLLCSNVVNFVKREIGKIVRYLPDQKNSATSQTVATVRIAPKICICFGTFSKS